MASGSDRGFRTPRGAGFRHRVRPPRCAESVFFKTSDPPVYGLSASHRRRAAMRMHSTMAATAHKHIAGRDRNWWNTSCSTSAPLRFSRPRFVASLPQTDHIAGMLARMEIRWNADGGASRSSGWVRARCDRDHRRRVTDETDGGVTAVTLADGERSGAWSFNCDVQHCQSRPVGTPGGLRTVKIGSLVRARVLGR